MNDDFLDNNYDYSLPKQLIAQKLANPRDHARLLIAIKNKNTNTESIDKIYHKKFSEIINLLEKGDVLAMNQTLVLHAKLVGKKSSGSKAELILTKDLGNNLFVARIKTKNPNPGQKIILNNGHAKIISRKNIDEFIIELSNQIVLKSAFLPNPPYIHRTIEDDEYQTIFAKKKGSLAAPTAGLHFTEDLIKKIIAKGVKIVFVTLHVGFGTFLLPKINQTSTEPEFYEITKDAANIINSRKGRLIVVGTTTLKAIETSSKDNKLFASKGFSNIFIKPGYKFNCRPDGLITNFHLPKSSLIMLTSAYYGKDNISKLYQAAIDKKYMFYSLGDAMMLL